MHEHLRDRWLGAWGGAVARRPKLTLALCLGIAGACVAWAALGLEFRPDRSELVDRDLPWNKRYLDYKTQFPRWGDIVVVMEGERNDDRVDSMARALAASLVESGVAANAAAGFDAAEAGPRLFRAARHEVFDRTLAELAEARRLAAAPNANAATAIVLAGLAAGQGDPSSLDRLEEVLEPYLSALEGAEPSFEFLNPQRSRWQPLVCDAGSGRLRFIKVQLARPASEGNLGGELAELRCRVREFVSHSALPGLAWGVTGLPAVEADETTQSTRDSALASALAFALITILMLVAFRGWIVPLLAAGCLLIGLAWSFGWLMLAVGHLQVLSVVFSSILMGLGIDYALLFITRLELIRDEHHDLAGATARVFRGVGPGMITGALTAAAAFASTTFTEFTGMSEMGLIAGGGILLCVVAVLSAFPAALAATGNWKRIVRRRHGGEEAHFAAGRLDWFDGHPMTTLAGALGMVGLMLFAARNVRYDSNVLRLQSPGVESVRWENRIVADDQQSIWSALVLTNPTQAGDLADRLRARPEVGGVGGMGLLFPADREDREARVRELRERTIEPPQGDAGAPVMLTQLAAVRLGLTAKLATVPDDVSSRLSTIIERISRASAAAATMSETQRGATWERLDQAFIAARDSLARWLDLSLAPEPPGPEELPAILREQWIGLDGSWLLVVLPASDPRGRSILDPERLEPFVSSVRSVAGDALGPPVQIYESSRIIVRSYVLAACYAVAVILLVLVLDFRNLADPLCCMAPVTVGFAGAFGLMGSFDVSLNFANLIVLPLIFGIGVDASVNMVHRWRREPRGRPAGLSGGTGRGITLAMLTTMIGFGALMVGQHRGIRSLGFLMFSGLAITLLACYTVLPAILALRTRGHPQPWDEAD